MDEHFEYINFQVKSITILFFGLLIINDYCFLFMTENACSVTRDAAFI